MSEVKVEKEAKKEEIIVDSPNQLIAYANMSLLSLTPEEAILHFGVRNQKIPNESDGVAKIYVSLPHVKRIAAALAQLVQRYEEMFGEINQDPAAQFLERKNAILEDKTKETPS